MNSYDNQSQKQKAVIVTGCSSGIGRATAVYLAKKEYLVFATVRKEKDAQNLRDLGEVNLIPVCPLDLTRLDQIKATQEKISLELVERGIPGLYALVNNAGGGSIAPIELMDLAKFRIEVETRLLGPVALVQELLPLLRNGHGRIVWIATPALLPVPYVAGIHIFDFALNCLARTLQLELAPWQISNTLIRCGGIQTAAPGKSLAELEKSFSEWPSERMELYKESLYKEMAELSAFDQKRSHPDLVGSMVYKALIAKKPRRRYQVGYMSRIAALAELLPQSLVDWLMAKRKIKCEMGSREL